MPFVGPVKTVKGRTPPHEMEQDGYGWLVWLHWPEMTMLDEAQLKCCWLVGRPLSSSYHPAFSSKYAISHWNMCVFVEKKIMFATFASLLPPRRPGVQRIHTNLGAHTCSPIATHICPPTDNDNMQSETHFPCSCFTQVVYSMSSRALNLRIPRIPSQIRSRPAPG